MPKLVEHRLAKYIRAIAAGETLEVKESSWDQWTTLEAKNALSLIAMHDPDLEFRIAANVSTINGIDFPEPCRIQPKSGDEYWIFNLHSYNNVPVKQIWQNVSTDYLLFAHGFAHLSPEAAQLHAIAIIKATS